MMMETGAVGFGLVEFLALLFGGNLLGLVPGERDPLLMKSAPDAAYVYTEWTARGPGQPGAPGIQGLVSDPEIETLVSAVKQAFAAHEKDADLANAQEVLHEELPGLLALVAQHSGGFYLARDAGLEGAPQGFNLIPPLEAAVILNLDSDVEAFAAKLSRVLRAIPDFQVPARFQETRLPLRTMPVDIRLHQEGPRFILALGAQTVNKLRTRWQQPEAGVNRLAMFQQSWQQVQVEKFGSLSWVNLASLRADLLTKLGFLGPLIQAKIQPLGINGIDSMLTVAGIERHDQVSRTHIALNGPGDGILSLFSGRPITAADLTQVPSDADFVAAVSLNLGNVHNSLREAAWQILPWLVRGVDFSTAQFQNDLQLSLGDLFTAFGEVWTLYDSPSNGGFAMTGMVASVPVLDPARAQEVMTRIRGLINESLPAGSDTWKTTLQPAAFGNETIYFLNSSGDHASLAPEERSLFSPAFCLTKDYFLVGMHPQALKAHLRFLKTSDTRLSKTAIPQVSGETLAQMYLNTPRVTQSIYPLLPLVLKPVFAGLQAEGVPIDLSVVPSSRAVLPYLRDTTASLVRRPDGLFLEQRNTMPVLATAAVLPRVLSAQRSAGSTLEADRGGAGIQLGAPSGADGVIQAKGDQPAKAAEETPVGRATRRVVPGFVRGLIPDVAQQFIPPDAFDKLGEPPDPAKAAERAAERQKRIDARNARRAIRRGMAPPVKPATPTPPQPSPP